MADSDIPPEANDPTTDSDDLLDVDEEDDNGTKSPDEVDEETDIESEECLPKRARPGQKPKKTRGRVKIDIELIRHKQKRSATFHKRKGGLMKKGFELSVLTGSEVLVVAASGDSVFSFATRKLQALFKSPNGRALIHACLSSPNPAEEADAANQGYSETELLSDGRRRETYIQYPNGSRSDRATMSDSPFCADNGTMPATPSPSVMAMANDCSTVVIDQGHQQHLASAYSSLLHMPTIPPSNMPLQPSTAACAAASGVVGGGCSVPTMTGPSQAVAQSSSRRSSRSSSRSSRSSSALSASVSSSPSLAPSNSSDRPCTRQSSQSIESCASAAPSEPPAKRPAPSMLRSSPRPAPAGHEEPRPPAEESAGEDTAEVFSDPATPRTPGDAGTDNEDDDASSVQPVDPQEGQHPSADLGQSDAERRGVQHAQPQPQQAQKQHNSQPHPPLPAVLSQPSSQDSHQQAVLGRQTPQKTATLVGYSPSTPLSVQRRRGHQSLTLAPASCGTPTSATTVPPLSAPGATSVATATALPGEISPDSPMSQAARTRAHYSSFQLVPPQQQQQQQQGQQPLPHNAIAQFNQQQQLSPSSPSLHEQLLPRMPSSLEQIPGMHRQMFFPGQSQHIQQQQQQQRQSHTDLLDSPHIALTEQQQQQRQTAGHSSQAGSLPHQAASQQTSQGQHLRHQLQQSVTSPALGLSAQLGSSPDSNMAHYMNSPLSVRNSMQNSFLGRQQPQQQPTAQTTGTAADTVFIPGAGGVFPNQGLSGLGYFAQPPMYVSSPGTPKTHPILPPPQAQTALWYYSQPPSPYQAK